MPRASGQTANSVVIFCATDEGHLDGSLQETEKSFFLLFDAANFLDLVAAKRAQFQQLAAAPPQTVDTLIAHDFPAMRALVCNRCVLVPRANQAAIGQHHRRSRPGYIELGNRDGNLGSFDQQFHVADP